MVEENPDKIDLRKTITFKHWKHVQQQTKPDILTLAVRETIEGETARDGDEAGQSNNNDNEHNESEVTLSGDEGQGYDGEVETERSETHVWEDEGMAAVRQVDELVNEMIRDDEIRALLDNETNDEGIELNLEDELDIESFDYRLEVELAEW